MAPDLWDSLDRIYKQKKRNFFELTLEESVGALPPTPRLSMKQPESRLPNSTRDEALVAWSTGYANEDYLTVSPVETFASGMCGNEFRRDSYGSAASPLSRDHSFISSNMSTHCHHGSLEEDGL